jgi:hypothetical protein
VVDIFKIPPKLKSITKNNPDQVVGYYAFAIMIDDIPRFIGAGKLRRAWNLSPEMESAKHFSRSFEIIIIEDNLTKIQAFDLKKRYKHMYADTIYKR